MARRQRGTTEFTGIQLGLLAVCVVAASGAIFLFGIYLGRGLPTHHAGIDDQVARIPVSEPPKVVAVSRGPMAAHVPAVEEVPEAAASKKEPAVMDSTVAQALETAGALPEALPRLKPVNEPPAAHDGDTGADAPPAVPAVPYTVQVLATRNKTEAEDLAVALKKQRIGAFVSEVEDASGNWYRVRIGIYDDLESAQVMETRLRNQGLQQAYVSRYR
jgi:cell division protein FtsN